jgi:hypothetical protein
MFVNRTDAVSRITKTNAKYEIHLIEYRGAYSVAIPGGYLRRMSRPGRRLRNANKIQ